MKNPCSCNTCPCHSQGAILSWEDDKDFSALRTLNATNYPLLDQRVIDEQPRGTKLLWRIRTLGNPNGFQGKAQYGASSQSAEIGLVMSMGPVVNGEMQAASSIQELYPAKTFPGFGAAGFPYGDGSWLFTGADNHPLNPIPGNKYVLDLGCVACNCFCTNLPKVEWPSEATNDSGANTDTLSEQERQCVYYRGDSYNPNESIGCEPTIGLAGGVSFPRILTHTPRFLNLIGGFYDGIMPQFADLTPIDVIFHDRVTPGGSGSSLNWQYDITNNPTESGPTYDLCEDIFHALNDWLTLGDKTLVMNFSGWITYNDPPGVCNYNEHGPILQAESIFGLDLFPECLADHDHFSAGGKIRVSSFARVTTAAASHPLMANVTTLSHKAVHGGLPVPSGAVVLMEANMPVHGPDPLIDYSRWEPVVVLHDVGNGSRIVSSVGNWNTGTWTPVGSNHGFLSAVDDAFIFNVINEHGNY